jgi:hypothetical protein
MLETLEDIWDRIWYDNKGNLVVWQRPNAWLIGWAFFTVLSLLFGGKTADIFTWIASAALIIWSMLELTKGVNWFRRALGALVLVYAILTLIKSF